MNRIEPTMPNSATLQKIALATGDFKQMYQAPVMQAVEEQDLALDENNYLLNPFSPIAYKAA